MILEPISIGREVHTGSGAAGEFRLGETTQYLDELCARYAGQVKLIYLDPPFLTGDHFYMRVRVGEKEWESGRGSLKLDAYSDASDRESFLNMMRRVLTACRTLLRNDGMLFLHIDYRTHPYLRLLGDEIFGESNFVNEIIWAYQTGGRSKKHFSRKHDVILFYRKSKELDFNIEAVMTKPDVPRSNHMRRHVDPDGRVYRSIRSGDRVYTYYDDDPVAPSDVWNDLSHLQQKDPERTGYDTQKPLSLLNRIVLCGSREGELVMDLFAGSGTTLEAAKRTGRPFFGMDQCPLTLNILRRRLSGAPYVLEFPPFEGAPACEAAIQTGVGLYHVTLEAFQMDNLDLENALDAVDNWSIGYLQQDGYRCMSEALRTKRTPILQTQLDMPIFAGEPAVCVSDVTGRCFYYRFVHT